MKAINNLSTVIATAILAAGLISPALAKEDPTLPFATEIDTCIAAVNANLDLLNATRVRHVVRQQDRTGQAFAFAIETSVFVGTDEKHYAAYCVAKGAGEPSRFRITESNI